MQIDNEFSVNVPIEEAWKFFTNLELVAPCIPGAQLTGVEDGVYSGQVKVKVGPVVSAYAGKAFFAEKDDAAYHAVIDAKGKDPRGNGNAAALITAKLREDDGQTVVTVNTDMNITGKIAQLGSGMIKEVSTKLFDQFVVNLKAKLLATSAADAAAGAAVPTAPTGGAHAAVVETPSDVISTAEVAAAPVVAAPATPEPANPSGNHAIVSEEAEPLDLMSLAGSSVYKRLIPVGIGAAVVLAVIVYFATK